MEFAVLGELRASDGEVDRTPRGQRSRDLLAVLLTRRGQAVDSTVLLDLVWGHAAAGLDISVVHTQVARLRRALGRRFIQTAESGYRLTDASTDADRFAELVARARGGTIGEPVTDLLREALALWRGDRAYSDVTLDLVAPEVTALQEARVAALELLAETLLGVADPTGPSGQAGPQRWPGSGPQAWSDPGGDNDRAGVEAALGVGRELIAREPLRERGYELAMLAAARSGRQVEALTMYERLRSTLRQELGIAPSASTRELHARLLRREHPLAIPVRAAAPTRAGTAPPAPTTAMIGRDRDMTCVARLLRDRRAVTITGTGGVGKSRLLSELHGRLAPGWSGYFDVGASTATSLGELAEEVGHAVRVRVDPPDPVATLVTAIGSRSLLLVVDEAETRLELCADLVGRLLGGCPGVRVLTASRRPLGLVGEAIHVLDPLECPDAQAGPSAISTAPAVLLLRERIADHAPDLVIADDQWAQLRDLARGMDGLPLALELLAARTRTCTLEDLADTLVDPLRLTATERDRPARHRSVRRAIAWSVDHLTPVQRDALGCLAVFVGPFTADAAKAAAGPIDDFDEVLRCLVRDALVHVQRGPDGVTLRILTPTRAYAFEELGPHCGLADAMARHRRWHGQRWRGALRSDALLADVRAHEPDYLHALNTALETGDRETTADLTLTLGKLWVFHDMLGPGLRWSARVLASGLLTPLETARILTMRSTLQSHHDPHQVRVDLSRAIPVLRRHGDVVWLTTAHLAAALERYAGGDLLGAREHAEQAVAASRGTTPERQADALGVLAVTALDIDGELADAAAAEAWALVTASDSAAAIASVSANLAWTHFGRGRHRVGTELLDRALARLSSGAVPIFLRLNRAWGALLGGAEQEAINGFAQVVSANPTGLEDRKSAEAYLGAAIAMVRSGHPNAAELLDGALSLASATGLVLTAWQQDLVAASRGQVGNPVGQPPTVAAVTRGARLFALLHQACDPLAGPTGSLSRGDRSADRPNR